MEDLAKQFDFIILGTGLPSSILSAAFSRIGKTVLQLDRHDFYGSEWASFSPKQIENWRKQNHGFGPITNIKLAEINTVETPNRICINLDNNPLFSAGEMIELLIQEKFKNIGNSMIKPPLRQI
jgi:RAB protein geranylgeranyltransferase component A